MPTVKRMFVGARCTPMGWSVYYMPFMCANLQIQYYVPNHLAYSPIDRNERQAT